mmetsp:Transcript_4749/g.10714  ORF Transcript_4749/g.10714 Transcript_4749/m.10714 type:complete len:120 (+) Transcript_4749:2470-2829(+)
MTFFPFRFVLDFGARFLLVPARIQPSSFGSDLRALTAFVSDGDLDDLPRSRFGKFTLTEAVGDTTSLLPSGEISKYTADLRGSDNGVRGTGAEPITDDKRLTRTCSKPHWGRKLFRDKD